MAVVDATACGFCAEVVPLPYSVCYDPEHERNCWGGDTHEAFIYFCERCAQERGWDKLRKENEDDRG